MKTMLMAIILVAGTALAQAPDETEGTQGESLREALDLQAPDYVLSGGGTTILAAKAACNLSQEKKKGLLKTCIYDCPCGTKKLRRKGNQECPETWYFDC